MVNGLSVCLCNLEYWVRYCFRIFHIGIISCYLVFHRRRRH